MLRGGVAAGHPATVAAGIEILEEGGSAADAAVAASLASCVAETVMTGLLGGGHAIHWDGREAWNLDCFVDVPSGAGAAAGRAACPLRRGARPLRGRAGDVRRAWAASRARGAAPALRPAALGAARRAGAAVGAERRRDAARPRRLPRDARARLHACNRTASASTRPKGGRSRPARHSPSPASARALELVADEGAASVYTGSIARALTQLDGIPVTAGRPRALRGALGRARRGRLRGPGDPHARRARRGG